MPTEKKSYNGELVFSVPTLDLREIMPALFNVTDQFMTGADLLPGVLTNRDPDQLLAWLFTAGRFISRDLAEDDPSLKQIIPYALVKVGDTLLIYTRGKKGGEARLHSSKSIGVGGHINPEDFGVPNGEHYFTRALRRELTEEIGLSDESILSIHFAGIVNEDSAPVGSVHLGVVYVVNVDPSVPMTFEDTLLDARLLTLEELLAEDSAGQLEGWSSLLVRDMEIPL